jgi:pyruvate dehydrogenase E1 component beta subunit
MLAAGAANAGLRPILVHQRLDFMLYTMDQLVNWISLWSFKSSGTSSMPLVIRAVVGKGWGQGPQHGKSLHTWFAHLPGLQVVMPSTPAEAKGLLLSSIFSNAPTIFIEGRSLYSMTETVPDRPYFIRLGRALVRRKGVDVTIVSFGSMLPNALLACDLLKEKRIVAEVIDLRTLMPLDTETILASVRKTGRLVVAEPGWRMFGAAAEIIATVAETLGTELKAKPMRVTWPHSHVPTSRPLEAAFYPLPEDIANACEAAIRG